MHIFPALKNENRTTRIDRDDKQVPIRVKDGNPIDNKVYCVNGSEIGGPDYDLQYERNGYPKDDYRDVGYAVSGYSQHRVLAGPHMFRATYGVDDYDWQFEGIKSADDGWTYSM